VFVVNGLFVFVFLIKKTRYGNANAWKYCTQVFDYLTLACLIDGRVMCVHAGLSPEIKVLLFVEGLFVLLTCFCFRRWIKCARFLAIRRFLTRERFAI
jgi:hypothetical protein